MRVPVLLAAVALAQPAPACPTADDLAKGIRFANGKGTTETFTRGENGKVVSTFVDPVGNHERMEMQNGIYMVSDALLDAQGNPDPTAAVALDYKLDGGSFPTPVAGTDWTVTVEKSGMGQTDSTRVVYNFVRAGEVSFGDCTYASLRIRIDYPDVKPPGSQQLEWLPDLGLAYLVQDGAFYVSIEAVQ